MKKIVDKAMFKVRSGQGGKGLESFIKKTAVKHIPDGGSGGKGGDVVFIADPNVFDLEYFNFNNTFIAQNGKDGGKSKKTGHNAKPLILRVPLGTTIRNERTGMIIRQNMQKDEKVIVAKGGKGGRGNHVKKSATPGSPGEEVLVSLDFVMPHDVSIIGMGNSGKSSFLSLVSGSKSRETSYPFSTKIPYLGTHHDEEYIQTVFCEFPSLIKGSSEGRGVGNYFLRHVEASTFVLFLLDPVSQFTPEMELQLRILRGEIEKFGLDISGKEPIVVVNKSDLLDDNRKAEMENELKDEKNVFFVSCLDETTFQEFYDFLEPKMKKIVIPKLERDLNA